MKHLYTFLIIFWCCVGICNAQEWNVLATFNTVNGGQQGVVCDGLHIYTCSWMDSPPGGFSFQKYNMQGGFVERFNISGINQIRDLTYDGRYCYGSKGTNYIYVLDLAQKKLIDSISTTCNIIQHISYDPDNDGFWVGYWNTLRLVNRHGQTILTAPAPNGAHSSGYFVDANNIKHLYLFCEPNKNALVYDYNITSNVLGSSPIFDFASIPGYSNANGTGLAGGCFVGPYQGKMALYGNVQQSPNLVAILELGEETPPAQNYATVILTAGDIWGDGTGYQMLLDADANAYGSVIPTNGPLTTSGDAAPEVYARFEYKIPENADGSLTTQNIVFNNSISIQIPAGVYDWCITNPTPGDRMWIASANGTIGGRQNDFTFESGKTYEFVPKRFGENDGVDLTITGTVVSYVITATANPSAGGTVSGEGTYDQGTTCTLVATPNDGYAFVSWTKNGIVMSEEPSYSFTVTEDAAYVARFKQSSYSITAIASPEEGGTVTGSGTYAPGITITLNAVANEGYQFLNWSEDGVIQCLTEEFSFAVDRDRLLVANFEKLPTFTISAMAGANGTITPQGDVQVLQGADQTFTMTPSIFARISKVLIDGIDIGPVETYTFSNVNRDHTIYVSFSGMGVEESQSLDVTVYPNPAKDIVYVEGDGIETLALYDLLGNCLFDTNFNVGKGLDVSSLSQGEYILKLMTRDGIIGYKKLIIE